MFSVLKTLYRENEMLGFVPSTGLPRNQTARHSNASASLNIFPYPVLCTAQLTSNTDGIINKLVTVFAFCLFGLHSGYFQKIEPSAPISTSSTQGASRYYCLSDSGTQKSSFSIY